MDVSKAVLSRKSTRAFLDTPISNSLLADLLKKASRAPSGGNLQPWKVFVINESSMKAFLKFQEDWNEPEKTSYDIYPKNLKEPYRTSRYEVGEQMYSILGISRDDKVARVNQVMKNFKFFGAPAAIFCYVDKQMGPPQWSDLGMFLQTFMLLATEVGLDTCAQEAWSIKETSVSSFFNIQHENDILFCGISIGYADKKDPLAEMRTSRRPLEEWAYFY